MNLTVKTLATACSAAALTAIVPAGTAAALPLFNGIYDIDGASEEFYWTVQSTCADEGCTANITSNRGWTAVATLTNGRWNFNTSKPDAMVCPNGSFAPIVLRYSLDAASLLGVVTADSNGECIGGTVTQVAIQLKKVG
jgi:hypothetical protein